MLEVENNLDKKINHKKQIIKYVEMTIDRLERSNSAIAWAIDSMGDALIEIRESKIDNVKLDLLDDTIETDQDSLYDMEEDLNNMLDRLKEDLKKFKETNV